MLLVLIEIPSSSVMFEVRKTVPRERKEFAKASYRSAKAKDHLSYSAATSRVAIPG
jgi:hypothetical protein